MPTYSDKAITVVDLKERIMSSEAPATRHLPLSRLLVPLDGSSIAEQAIPFAQSIAPPDGEIVLFTAVPEVAPLLAQLASPIASAPDAYEAAALAAAQRTLEEAAIRYGQSRGTSPLRSLTAAGDPAAAILRISDEREIDMVVMTTRGRGAIGRSVHGSVADRVTRCSRVPVLLIHPRDTGAPPHSGSIERLVVPLDGSSRAESSLPLVIALATRLRVPVLLVRVVSVMSITAWPEEYRALVTQSEQDAGQYLATIAANLAHEGIVTSTLELDGSPFFAISDATEPGDVVVITSHGRGGVLRWFLGSVAEKLVREAPVPVLVIPAEGRGGPRASPM